MNLPVNIISYIKYENIVFEAPTLWILKAITGLMFQIIVDHRGLTHIWIYKECYDITIAFQDEMNICYDQKLIDFHDIIG